MVACSQARLNVSAMRAAGASDSLVDGALLGLWDNAGMITAYRGTPFPTSATLTELSTPGVGREAGLVSEWEGEMAALAKASGVRDTFGFYAQFAMQCRQFVLGCRNFDDVMPPHSPFIFKSHQAYASGSLLGLL